MGLVVELFWLLLCNAANILKTSNLRIYSTPAIDETLEKVPMPTTFRGEPATIKVSHAPCSKITKYTREPRPLTNYSCTGVGVFSSVLAIAVSLSTTGIGAIRRFLLSRPSSNSGTDCKSRFFDPDVSSRSDSLLSLSRLPRLPMFGMPLTELLALWLPWPGAGVSGGVHIGTGPELVAAKLGTEDMAGVGAFIEDGSPALGAKEAILDTELLRVGLPGRAGMNELGDAGKPADGCRCIGGAVAATEPDMLPVVGVGVGVE